ncbi:NUDIX domain-containing protein, partial [Alcanivorax jadensis]
RELFVRPQASAVLPYDPRRGEILLVEQFRVGALEWRQSPWCLELIAGIADKDGESAADLIRREAMEEAGITLGEMETIAAYMPSPGGTNERLQVFVGQADLADAGGIFGCPDEGEDIRALTVPVAEIPELLASGLVDNAASLIALQWLLLHRDRLDAAWDGV